MPAGLVAAGLVPAGLVAAGLVRPSSTDRDRGPRVAGPLAAAGHLVLIEVGLEVSRVAAAVRQGPDEGAGLGLLKAPAWCLLGPVIAAA